MEQHRTELSELGEFGLIDHISKGVDLHQSSSLLGIGDDAAMVDPNGQAMVMSTDLLCEGVHFNLMYAPLKHLGYKAIMVNLSDIYAMNATPTQVLVSIAVSNRFSVEAVNELYDGIKTACAKHDVDLVGGDVSSSTSGLTISVTACGLVNETEVVKRSGAQKGDLLIVSGDLGAAYMGLQILEREKEVFQAAPTAQPDLSGFEYLLERQLKPEARRDVIELLAQLEVIPTSMIDISDGLASEALHLSKSSNKSIKIYEEKLPIHPQTKEAADQFNLDVTTPALNGGEEYESLFTVSQGHYDTVKDAPEWTIIGYVGDEEGDNELITKSGQVVPIQAQGWKHI
ncbi:MAG: thiamine-phosphate kinase [Flavobacteriales bacterium]|nr:thiamine-phosphate kinase [Flavobacteriales bacterium]